MPASLHYKSNSLQGSCNLFGRLKGIGPLGKAYHLRGLSRRSEHRWVVLYKIFEGKKWKARKIWAEIYGLSDFPVFLNRRDIHMHKRKKKKTLLIWFNHKFLSFHWILTVYKCTKLLFHIITMRTFLKVITQEHTEWTNDAYWSSLLYHSLC